MFTHKRICIVGNCGSGKSSLAIKIGEKLGTDVHHLDNICYDENWQKKPVIGIGKELKLILAKDRWIIDGNHKSTFDLRFARAELVIFVDINPLICAYRAFLRMIRFKYRPDLQTGQKERINLPFYKYILSFRKKVNPIIEDCFKKYKHLDVVVIKKQGDIDKFLEKLSI